jgi:hypothetical protein
MSNEPKLQELVALHAMVTRMRVLSSPRTVTCAEKIMKATVDTYFAPVLGFVHHTHAAATQLLEDAVMRNSSAYHDGRPASARTQLSYRNYM